MNEKSGAQIIPNDVFENLFPNLPLLDVVSYRLVNQAFKKSADAYLIKALKIQQLACGVGHSIALLNDGRVLVWGSNITGQLGLEQSIDKTNYPQEIWGIEKIIHIAAEGWHSIFLTENREILACGSNEHQQLGLTEANIFFPQKIPGIDNVESIATDFFCTAVLKQDGLIQQFGTSENIEVHAWNNKIILLPNNVLIPSNNNIQAISATISHAILLSNEYAYGTGEDGGLLSLGLERTEPNKWEAIEVLNSDQDEVTIKKILTVDTASFLLTTENDLLVTGFNNMGHLGPNAGQIQFFEKIQHHKQIYNFAANRSHTLMLNADDELLAMGCNNDGELGIGDGTENTATTVSISNISQENDDIFMSDDEQTSMPVHKIVNTPTYVNGFFKLKRELLKSEVEPTKSPFNISLG